MLVRFAAGLAVVTCAVASVSPAPWPLLKSSFQTRAEAAPDQVSAEPTTSASDANFNRFMGDFLANCSGA